MTKLLKNNDDEPDSVHIRRDKIKEKQKNMQENIQEINIFTEYLQQVLYC